MMSVRAPLTMFRSLQTTCVYGDFIGRLRCICHFNIYYEVYVIGHNNLVKYLNITIVFRDVFNMFFYDFPKRGRDESRPYGAGGFIYNSAECVELFMRTYCDEIYSSIIAVPFGSELMSICHQDLLSIFAVQRNFPKRHQDSIR